MKIIRILVVLSLIFSSLSITNTEREKLSSYLIHHLNENRETPLNYEKYITNLNSATQSYSGTLSNQNDINTLKKRLNINSNNINLLSTLLKNKKTGEIKIFKQNDFPYISTVNEILGGAIFTEEKKIYYLIFVARSYGTVLQQIERKTRRVCTKKKGIFHKKHCWDEPYEEKRANTVPEKKLIEKTLLSKSILSIKSRYYEENEKIQRQIESNNQNTNNTYSDTYKKIQSKKNIFYKNIESLIDNSRKNPYGYDKLVRNIKSYTDVNMDMFQKNELESICKKYNLPNDVKNQLRSLLFASKPNAKKNIKYLNEKSKVSIDELLGYAMKENDIIYFAFIRSTTEGEMPYRTKLVSVKVCHKTFFGLGRSCHYERETKDDPYTANELLTVKNALIYISAQSFKKKLNTIKESQTLLGMDRKIISNNKIYCAIIGNDGRIYIGPNPNPKINIKKVIGNIQSQANAPYSLQIKENGNIFIINKNNDKVWSSETSHKGVAPFDLILRDDGKLDLIDSKKTVVYSMKK